MDVYVCMGAIFFPSEFNSRVIVIAYASGDVMWTMVIAIVSMWVFRIGTAYFFSNVFHLGLIGVWIAMTIDWMFRGICYGFRYYSGKWEKAMH